MEQSYKEKYEDILARLERAKNDNDVCDERFCCVINDLIPELAESEDEVTRKEIINYFQCQSEEEPTRKEIHNKWITWLEKQAEHANFLSKIQVGDKVTRNENGVLVNLSQLNRVAKKNEKQGEHAIYNVPAREVILAIWDLGNEWKELTNGCISTEYGTQLDYIQKHWHESEYYLRAMQDEQKPEENKGNIGGISPNWSKEDEQHIDSLLKRLDALCRNKFECTRFAISEDKDWLKSLRPQPKQSLDEDTQQWIDTIIKDYEDLYNTDKDHGATIQAKISILKSLRPQSHWKPSELQLVCLSDAIKHYNSLDYPASKLKELYEQLKKLKEE